MRDAPPRAHLMRGGNPTSSGSRVRGRQSDVISMARELTRDCGGRNQTSSAWHASSREIAVASVLRTARQMGAELRSRRLPCPNLAADEPGSRPLAPPDPSCAAASGAVSSLAPWSAVLVPVGAVLVPRSAACAMRMSGSTSDETAGSADETAASDETAGSADETAAHASVHRWQLWKTTAGGCPNLAADEPSSASSASARSKLAGLRPRVV